MTDHKYDVTVNLLHFFTSLAITLLAAFTVTHAFHVPAGFAARAGFVLVWVGAYLLLHHVLRAGAVATSIGALAWILAPLAQGGAAHG